MSLKYNCPLCGFEIISDFLAPGDLYRCPSCGNKIFVPDDAIETEEAPNLPEETIVTPCEDAENRENGVYAVERDLEEKERPREWDAKSVVKFVFAYLLSMIPVIIISLILSKLIAVGFYPEDLYGATKHESVFWDSFMCVARTIGYFIPIILIYYSVVIRHKNDFLDGLNIDKLPGVEYLRWGLISAAFTFILIGFFAAIEASPVGEHIPEEIPIDKNFSAGYFKAIVYSIFVLTAPIQEEIIFRGYIFKGLANSIGVIWSGVIVTVIFTALHASQLGYSPILISFILPSAIFMIIVRIKTGSLTKCIIIHQVYNTIFIGFTWLWILLFGLDTLPEIW